MKVEDLSGKELDYWAGKALKQGVVSYDWNGVFITEGRARRPFSPSQNPLHAEPIVENSKICTVYNDITKHWRGCIYQYSPPSHAFLPQFKQFGDTRMIAAMRTWVMANFGADVPDDIPQGG